MGFQFSFEDRYYTRRKGKPKEMYGFHVELHARYGRNGNLDDSVNLLLANIGLNGEKPDSVGISSRIDDLSNHLTRIGFNYFANILNLHELFGRKEEPVDVYLVIVAGEKQQSKLVAKHGDVSLWLKYDGYHASLLLPFLKSGKSYFLKIYETDAGFLSPALIIKEGVEEIIFQFRDNTKSVHICFR